MTVSRDKFDQGMSWEEYLAQFKLPNDAWRQNFEQQTIDPDLVDYFRGRGPLFILTTTEDWCGDARAYVPVVARLAAECPNIEHRIFLRDQNLDITDQYLKDGQHRSIPVFVLFDADFRELGHFIERPQSVTDFNRQQREQWAAENPQHADILDFATASEESRKAYRAASAGWAQQKAVEFGNVVLRELKGIAEREPAAV
jgi:hypothetical protein